jgi:hypothetical protein
MPYRLIVGLEAEQDLDVAFNWYNERIDGLGKKFLLAVEIRLKQLNKSPALYKKTRLNLREAKVDKFPFVILYKVFEKNQVIFVTSVHHTSRNPKRKYRRHKRK